MKKFIGDRKFYKYLFAIVIPIVLQQFITQFVGLIDNLMIGQVGQSQMTGVSLANQLLFIFNLAVFGSIAGGSIFATQYFGSKNKEGYLESLRFKWLISAIILIVSSIIFFLFHDQLLNFFINQNEADSTNPTVVLESGRTYLLIMLLGNVPFVIKEIYAISLREMKETFIPMLAGVIAIIFNLVFNYILIFGKLGFPELGIIGAAIATVGSRFVELGVIALYIFIKHKKYPYLFGIFKSVIKFKSIKLFFPKSMMLLWNEIFWSTGITLIFSCYALRGLDTVSALNISNTVTNVFLTLGISLGNATGIILGNMLGNNDIIEAKNTSYRILAASIVITLVASLCMVITSLFLPNVYKISSEIKESSRILILLAACFLPFQAFNTCCYFTLRTGGKVFLTILFDSLFIWAIKLPFAFLLCKFTPLSIFAVYALVESLEILKSSAGYICVDKGIWLKQLV